MRDVALAMLVIGLCGLNAQANLLTNGDLNDPGIHESDTITAWTLVEPDLDLLGGSVNSATFANFANHSGVGGVGLWYRSFEGGLGSDLPFPFTVNADLYQAVPGLAGGKYALSAWFLMESGYSGLDDTFDTQTLLALDFLDAGGVIGTVSIDIDDLYDTTAISTWQQFMVMGVSPAGTVSVQARTSMIDGEDSDANPQSAFVDDFELLLVEGPGDNGNVIPEPATAALFGMAMLGAFLRRRPTGK